MNKEEQERPKAELLLVPSPSPQNFLLVGYTEQVLLSSRWVPTPEAGVGSAVRMFVCVHYYFIGF